MDTLALTQENSSTPEQHAPSAERVDRVAGAASQSIFVIGARGVPNVEGGAEKNAEMLFPLVAAAGYPVTLMGLKQYIEAAEYRGVKLIAAPSIRFLNTDKLIGYVLAIFMALRLRPRIVHFQGLGSALFLWVYKLFGMKTVVRYGSTDYLVGKWGPLGKFGFWISEYQLRIADAVIAVAPSLARHLAARGIQRNVHIVPNAVDLDANAMNKDGPHPEGDYVLTVGRVTAQKNVANLIHGFEAFAEKDGGACRLVIAGGLDDAAYVEQLVPLITPRIAMIGRVPRSDMGSVYANCRLYVNSSMHEGNSNAVLEAISAGCPVLLSDIPENRDFGLPDRHYFDHGDPAAIAAAIGRALADPGAYIADPRSFLSWQDVADRTVAIYRTLHR